MGVERAVTALYRAAIVVALVVLISDRGAAIATLTGLVALVFLASVPLLAVAWFGGLSLALWSLVLLTRGRRLVLAGILGGLAMVFRPDMVLAIGLLAIGFRSKRYVQGVLLGLIPYVPPCRGGRSR